MSILRGKAPADLKSSEAAIIDVGSNSVRLVAYRLDGRAMIPYLNEKVMAGLGRNLRISGRLSPDGVDMALRGLNRFRTLLDALKLDAVEAVATAAVRDAEDGPAFAERVKKETGITLRIISGVEEAQLSALGVWAGAPEAKGVVGDLGGSSLELIEIGSRGAGRGESHPLGPLSLMDGQFVAERVEKQIDAALASSSVLERSGGDFYAVGGAWRALGRIDMELREHPLGVLHHHEMSRADLGRVVDLVRKSSRRSLEKMPEAAAKRADALPYAALALERVVRRGGFERVILSSFGLREGLLVQRLAKATLEMHPLIASAQAFGAPGARARAFGAALDRFIAPAMTAIEASFSQERDAILRAAACRLADLGSGFHPDQREEIMFDLVLRAPFAGISHAERAWLAGAVHHRYTKSAPEKEPAFVRLLDDRQKRGAAAIGAAMRLGADLSGRSEALLAAFSLTAQGGKLTLSVTPAREALVNETAMKRLEPLAVLLGLQPRIV